MREFLLLLCASVVAVSPLPSLPIDTAGVSISGLSSGADFTVQFQVAYSSLLKGSGVFAGQPWHCAVTRFPGDPLTPPNPSVPYCDGCPPNTTLVYDHCKNLPSVVIAEYLIDAALQAARFGDIDDGKFLNATRIYLYLGTQDPIYLPGSMHAVWEFFAGFMNNITEQILFNETTPSAHCWPSADYGSPCGNSSDVIENCNYDGPGAALQHIYEGKLRSPVPYDPTSLHGFDQRPFWGPDPDLTGLNSTGLIYIPKSCTQGTSCLLHVSLHGCGVNGYFEEAAYHLSYVNWAEANNMVVLFPRMGNHGNTTQTKMGCWDAYGQTGPAYDTKRGPQMIAVRQMIASVMGDSIQHI